MHYVLGIMVLWHYGGMDGFNRALCDVISVKYMYDMSCRAMTQACRLHVRWFVLYSCESILPSNWDVGISAVCCLLYLT
jgi:hypothetical protein